MPASWLRCAAGQGLDPASRRNLWDVVKGAKAGRAIVLTTHSMEEAEMLCDRLGIFVDGRLVCIGNPKEITRRYGGFLVRRRAATGAARAQRRRGRHLALLMRAARSDCLLLDGRLPPPAALRCSPSLCRRSRRAPRARW